MSLERTVGMLRETTAQVVLEQDSRDTRASEAPSSSSYIRDFNRYEFKYLVGFRERERLLETIGPFIRRDTNADSGGVYKISSLYYDSPGLDSFWEKIDGVKFRRKFRTRVYRSTPDTAYLEIKQRIDKTVQKRRVKMPLDEAELLLQDLSSSGLAQRWPMDPVVHEIAYLFKTKHSEPKAVVSYHREAFFAIRESDLRITFDSRLKYRCGNLSLREPFAEEGRYFCHPEQIVIEVKFNNRIPLWLCRAIQHLGLQSQRVSKYCLAVNAGYLHKEFKL